MCGLQGAWTLRERVYGAPGAHRARSTFHFCHRGTGLRYRPDRNHWSQPVSTRAFLFGAGFALCSALTGQRGHCADTRAAAGELDPVLRDTLKGEARLVDVPDYSRSYLSLLPPDVSSAPPAAAGSTPPQSTALACGPNLSGTAVVIGPRDQFAKAKSVGLGLLSQLASAASGGKLSSAPGGGSKDPAPLLAQDPIKGKFRNEVKDKASGTKLDLGGQLARDGMLLSTRLDSVSGKGTVQEIYLERDDCRRIYPTADYAYELWGSWSLSVSWTRTESTYQDGKLLNQTSTSGGFPSTR